MHGEPALPADFPHLPYANPDAPKGGRLTLAYLGAFDSLNPYNVKALSTAQGLIGNVYQSLMMRSADEPFTLYGLIAQLDRDRRRRAIVSSSISTRARISPTARRSPPPTSLFTFELLKEKGRPQQRAAYAPGASDRRARRPDRPLRPHRRAATASCR